MPQETNLNVAPYFDDFTPDSNYYKVLFKPGFPVQARELTTMQSILQNQIEDMGDHLFKEGARVIPGGLTFKDQFFGIQIDPEFLGVPVSLYLDQLIGKEITGSSSGVTAKVITYITDEESEKGNYTIYINYIESGDADGVNTFFDNEVLKTTEDISYATTFIAEGEGFANTITVESNAIGMAYQQSAGIYFLRGHFVDVHDQVLILDQYNNTSSWRVGFKVEEDVISADIDPSLADNAQGFNNYTAPGADRLRITATLTKKEPNELNDENFVQISTVTNGAIEKDTVVTEYNHLADEFAKRTWEESGHYYVKDFTTTVRECLNDGMGNRGIYQTGQITAQGNEPADNLMVYKLSPGKAYVKGYEVQRRTPALFDVVKPRDVKTVTNQAVNFGFGPSFTLNNVSGAPTLGFNNNNTISLRSKRVSDETTPSATHISSNTNIDNGHVGAAGEEIGIARIYDYALESGSYQTGAPTTNQWDVSLWDVQMYTKFELNAKTTLSVPCRIEGQSSGASAYLKDAVTGVVSFTAYNVKGNFFPGERLTFNGVDDDDRFTVDIDNYEISDIQSLWSSTGVGKTFTGDLIPRKIRNFGGGRVAAPSVGLATITSAGDVFAGIVTTGDLIRYKRPGQTLATINIVAAVKNTSLTLRATTDVANVFSGALPSSAENVSGIRLVGTAMQNTAGSGNASDNESLYSVLPKENVQYVDLVNSNIIVRRQFTGLTITNRKTSTVTADDNETFMPYDEERYTLVNASTGAIIPINANKLKLTNGSTTLQFKGLNVATSTNVTLIATLRKSNITSKTKIKKVSVQTLIDKSSNPASGIGGTSLNDGLTYGENGSVFPYGTRVQDQEICLNVPDVNKVYGVYESVDTNDPQSPGLTIGSMDGPSSSTNDFIVGEEFVGESSGGRGLYVVRKSDVAINFIYLNNNPFEEGEIVTFQDSNVTGVVNVVDEGSPNVTQVYDFETGQVGSHYGYSRLIRKANEDPASKKLIVYYSRGTYDTNDVGDITTVNSYGGYNYGTEIPSVNGNRNTDLIDARPRVSEYTVAAGTRSPFEFLGRSFDDSGNSGAQHSAKYILASDESMSMGFNYYLPRADRVYIDKTGFIQVVYGAPADEPQLPEEVSGAMNIANIYLPAYLYKTSHARVKFIEHKRYQMSDISKLEQRIKNLEYYTSLNTVESEALNKFIPDADGLNRFKSGVFVDNFTTVQSQDMAVGVKNSIDKKKGVLRPSHYSTAINMQVASNAIPGIGNGSAEDSNFADLMGTNVRRTGNMITLDYTDEIYQFQPYATRVENVTPFLVMFWKGAIKLDPDTDIWIDVTKMQPNDVMMEGSFQGIAEALGAEVTTNAQGKRMGITPVVWNSWETVGVNMDLGLSNQQETWQNATSNRNNRAVRGLLDGINVGEQQILDPSDSVVNNITASGSISLDQQRTGSQKTVVESIDTSSLGSRVVKRDIINFMRSREIMFTGTDFKPYNRVYGFFDGVDVNKFLVPKLIEIKMENGTFRPGEEIVGRMRGSGRSNRESKAFIRCRVAKSNHKYGPHRRPSDIYTTNPYNRRKTIPASYSSGSTTLNIDCWSLASDDYPRYRGYIAKGMILRGRSSGARAKVTNVRLIPDKQATIIGTFHVPHSSVKSNPVFETGRSTFRLTGSKTNSKIKGTYDTSGEETFYSQGDIDSTQETTLSMRNAKVRNQEFQETQTIGGEAQSNTISQVSGFDVVTNVTQEVTEITNITNEITNVTEVTNVTNVRNVTNVSQVTQIIREPREWGDDDPLAQTFGTPQDVGMFVTKVDFYFAEKDKNIPVTFQMRTTKLGTPTTEVLPYSEVHLTPDQVKTSSDATVPTTFTFEAPVYLEPATEYAMVLKSKITNYKVYISRLGEADIRTLGSEAGRVIVSKQPVLGSLFKSQNASVWTPSQYEDIKFDLYRAKFKSRGSISFYNSELPEDMEDLSAESCFFKPNKIRVAIGGSINQNSITDTALQAGNTVYQAGNDKKFINLDTVPHGSLVGFAGSIRSYPPTASATDLEGTALKITNPGVGYTPASGTYVFNNVQFTNVEGIGAAAVGFVTVTDGELVGAGISYGVAGSGGYGYKVGDVLTCTLGNDEVGTGGRITVVNQFDQVYGVGQTESGIASFNELILTDVQGDFDVSASANQLWYIDNVGVGTEVNGGELVNGRAIPQSPIVTVNDGLHMKILQKNHGMYNDVNKVTLSDILSDVTPTQLTSNYGRTSTSAINVKVGSGFTNFEGLPVGTGNTGYIMCEDEIIGYTAVSGNKLTGITRSVDGSLQSRHERNDVVYKYEFGGISLRRINKTHDLADASADGDSQAITIDSYKIKIDTSDTGYGVDRSSAQWDPTDANTKLPLKFKTLGKGGGEQARGQYNIPFSIMIPKFETMSPTGCKISAQARTITGTSVDGNEPAFQDKGYQEVSMFKKNYFDSARCVASPANEAAYLGDLPGNKSLTMLLNLSASDERLSPMINLDHAGVTFVNNRINKPISNYATDFRSNLSIRDPDAFLYVTKNVTLENPATSLQVILDGYVPDVCDVRVFYALNQDGPVKDAIFVPFPGYKNLNVNGDIITPTDNDGEANKKVPKVDTYVAEPHQGLYKEYTYSIEDLDPFKQFRIKIVGTSTDSAVVPQFQRLRASALA